MNNDIKKSISKWLIISIILISILVIAAGAFYYAYIYYNNSIYNPLSETGKSKKVDIIINKGSSTDDIVTTLFENGLIKNKTTLKIYLKLSNQGNTLKAGKYELNSDMNVPDIINKIVKGDVKKDTIKITIPEGYSVKDIAAAFEKSGLGNKDKFIEIAQNYNFEHDFLKNLSKRPMRLEGYLFPDTYEFLKDVTPEQIIKRMLDRFNEIFSKEMIKKTADMNLTIDKVVTMASIIEKEARVEIERPVIASVYYNRLKIKMPLQADATVQYALGQWKEKLLYKDLEINSPYNTYKYPGLPVGPIANPGRASIDAALNPDNVDYLYYVAKNDGSGTHAFTKTYQDFLTERQKNKTN